MLMLRSALLTGCCIAAGLAYAQTPGSVLKLPSEIEFKSPLGTGSQTAVLYGDPTKSGVYVTRVKIPAGEKNCRIGIPTNCVRLPCSQAHSILVPGRRGMRAK